jgi:large subunit ribosomal protein L10
MAINKEKKIAIVDKLNKIAKADETVVFVNFHGLSVALNTELRNSLRSQSAGYFVAKKTLIKRALGDKFDGQMPELEGEIALAYSSDPLASAKGVYDFQKKNADKIKIAGGIFEGRYLSAEAMTHIASIPGREILYGQFVNLINSPIQGLVIALRAVAAKRATA